MERAMLILLAFLILFNAGCIRNPLEEDCDVGKSAAWDVSACHIQKASIYAMEGMREKALQECEAIRNRLPNSFFGQLLGFGSKGFVEGYNTCIERVAVVMKDKEICDRVILSPVDTFLDKLLEVFPSYEKFSIEPRGVCRGNVDLAVEEENFYANLWVYLMNPDSTAGLGGIDRVINFVNEYLEKSGE